jgi:hypothetical protein
MLAAHGRPSATRALLNAGAEPLFVTPWHPAVVVRTPWASQRGDGSVQ